MTNDKTSRNMQVVLRVRPFSRSEMEQNQRNIVRVADTNTIIFDPDEDDDEFFFHGAKQTHRDITKRVSKNLTMTFDQVFDNQASNRDIYMFAMRPLVSSVMEGYNCSAFVYGATGAGKTFTMLGSDDIPGIAYLTMKELFEQIKANSEERKFDIGISYLEVYNEQVMNLLTKRGPLKLREDSNGVTVGGLELKPIFDADELLSLLALGNRNRTQHPTDANAESSRSHAIFQVHIRMTNKVSNQKRTVKLSMIDLAGSERGSSTKCIGQRFKEGASINKSLLALGNCINKLADGSKHIPYRDSNMTRILKDSLGGNCRTVMIANISPSSITYEDTYNTLKYASRAQKIRTTTITKNLFKSNLPKEYYVNKLTDKTHEVEELQKCIKALQAQIHADRCASMNNNLNPEEVIARYKAQAETWKQKIDKIYNDIRTAQENYYMMSSKEKLLKLRTKFKESTEKSRKIFSIDSECMKRDLARVEASIGKFSKQIEVFRIDKDRWMCRFKASKTQLAELQIEIASLNNPILETYLDHKEGEQKNVDMQLKSEHTMKVLQFYNQEAEKSRKIIELSHEILQEAYCVLNGNMLITEEMRERFNHLYKIHDQRGVKFTESDEIFEISEQRNQNDFLFDTDPLMMAKDDDDTVVYTNKRTRDQCGDDNDEIPTKKRVVRSIFDGQNLDATQVLGTHDDLNLDNGGAQVRALKESNPNVRKAFVVPKPMTKTVAKVKSTMITPHREKENKRTPLKIRRSPRSGAVDPNNKYGIRPKLKPNDILAKRAKDDAINRFRTFPKK
ncbi:kinesin-like protein KIF18A isoform X2 [Sitodiplosis mosellana]|uniref:kinesin-like protein KIF18A isoform X2 n=1 Tax=Sitodiplosis mosellana TaxID=263140 RepID=UPI002443C1C0|nr:kinesin-like protein KIF18A isoform X2 [Sitodiplosis mosellana]